MTTHLKMYLTNRQEEFDLLIGYSNYNTTIWWFGYVKTICDFFSLFFLAKCMDQIGLQCIDHFENVPPLTPLLRGGTLGFWG